MIELLGQNLQAWTYDMRESVFGGNWDCKRSAVGIIRRVRIKTSWYIHDIMVKKDTL